MDGVVIAVPPVGGGPPAGPRGPGRGGRARGRRDRERGAGLALAAGGARGLTGSGLLVPPVEGRAIKAATSRRRSGPGSTSSTPAGGLCGCRSAAPARRRSSSAPTRSWWPSPRRPRGAPAAAGRPGRRRASRAGAVASRSTAWGTSSASRGSARPSPRRPALAICGAVLDGVGIPACVAAAAPGGPATSRRPGSENARMSDAPTRAATAPGDQRHDPIHDVVGVRRRPPAGGCRPRGLAAEVEELLAELQAEGRRRPRHVRRLGAAGRRRPHGLVARAGDRVAAGGVPGPARTALGAGCARSGPPPRSTGRPSSTRGTSRRSWPARSRARTCACTRSCAPTTGTCCRTPSVAACSWSTDGGARVPRRPREHGLVVRAGRLRVGAGVRGRRAAPDRRPHARAARPPAPGATSARRSRSTPARGCRSRPWSRSWVD